MSRIRFSFFRRSGFTTGLVWVVTLGGDTVAARLTAQPVAPAPPVATVAFEGTPASPFILGSRSCSTSGCHGGADDKHNQVIVWSQRDVHARSYATLTTARSARMAEALRIPDPLTSARCTTCHAPAANVSPARLAPDVRVNEGVSCASCHGPDNGWLRSHTRPDYTHADRVAAGLRELGNAYARANACVACHQTIDPELLNVGKHPRLIFELDGQTASQPRHWKEELGWDGGRAWLVGQAVALREISHALVHGTADVSTDTPRWQALVWLIGQTGVQAPTTSSETATMENFTRTLAESDALARAQAADIKAFDAAQTLARLAGSHEAFRDASTPRTVQALRAERLVLALDRLLAALPAKRSAAASKRLDALFARAQSLPDFAPAEFATELAAFEKTLP